MSRLRLITLAAVAVVLAGCGSGYKQPNIEIYNDELPLADGTTIRIVVTGRIPEACEPGTPAAMRFDCIFPIPRDGCPHAHFRVDPDDVTGPALATASFPRGKPADPHQMELYVPVVLEDC